MAKEILKELPLVDAEQGLKLKEIGFNWHTEFAFQQRGNDFHLVHDSKDRDLKNWNKDKHVDCSAPTVALALQYLISVKSFSIWTGINNKGLWSGYVRVSKNEGVQLTKNYKSKQKADSGLLSHVLFKIEIVKKLKK